MGLGITKDGSMTVYTVPLVGLDDTKWDDNTWLTEHLRHLARKIEESRFRIISIGTETHNTGKPIPELVVKGYEHYVIALNTGANKQIRAVDFDAMSSRAKWDSWEGFVDVKWVCGSCHQADETDASFNNWDGKRESIKRTMDSIECPYCGNMLTHRTNGGQSDPFNWTFENK